MKKIMRKLNSITNHFATALICCSAVLPYFVISPPATAQNLAVKHNVNGGATKYNLILATAHLKNAIGILQGESPSWDGDLKYAAKLSTSDQKAYIRRAPDILNELRLKDSVSIEQLRWASRVLSLMASYMGFPNTMKEYWGWIESSDKKTNAYRVFFLSQIIRQRVGV